ncbi:MAG: zf-HC2 domain-containing protein [Candidatus Rokubacteria bacterium]|nr:zf-HC2 domain-containing protein [Candidatus Rokubacteria bacterium]
MSCHDARELFSALIDEALTADERRALDGHLAGCGDCRRELERFRGTVALVRGLEPARAPAGFADRVLAAARPTPRWRRLARALVFPLPLKLPLEAAAIVLVGVIVGLVYRQTPEVRQAAPEATLRDKGDTKDERAVGRAAVESDEAGRRVEPAAPPAISGRLVADDRDASERAILALVERAGGASLLRRTDPEGVVLEVVIPRAAWPELARELGRLGRWQPTREPAAMPDPVRVAVHIVG